MGSTSTLLPAFRPPCTQRAATTTFFPACLFEKVCRGVCVGSGDDYVFSFVMKGHACI
jgi:hypothetical protein